MQSIGLIKFSVVVVVFNFIHNAMIILMNKWPFGGCQMWNALFLSRFLFATRFVRIN